MLTRRSLLANVATLTGSVAFGVATLKSDEDWLIGITEAIAIGVRPEDVKVHDVGCYGCDFLTYREGNLNLIISDSPAFHERWMQAHRHCVIERPRERARRVKIFRFYLYGEGSLT